MPQRLSWIWFGMIFLVGCSNPAVPKNDGQTRIVCSFFPIYLFTKNVVGDAPGVTVELLLPAQAGCPHDYDLTPSDVKRLSSADVYVMNGAGLESFGTDQIKKANPKVVVIDSSTGVKKIELSQHHDHEHEHAQVNEHDHDHAHEEEHKEHAHGGHSHSHGHDHHHDGNVNPHFFSSPKGAAAQVKTIAEELSKVDPKNASVFAVNAKAYEEKLQSMDAAWSEASKSFRRIEIVTMHEVFDYVARDCGLKVVATIYPVAGQDPSPAEVRQVIDKIRDTKAAAVFTEPQYPAQVAKMIAQEAGVAVQELDPVASGPPDAPLDYYQTRMQANIETLTRLLAGESK
ncbi:metal ABC transporter substrate-binding protein [bacterium]|nr:metal ABC transporter substrate-binding protein [bacterium]